jgi:hypothetical protein
LAPVCEHGPEKCAICSNQIEPFISKGLSEEIVVGKEDAGVDHRWDALNNLDLPE